MSKKNIYLIFGIVIIAGGVLWYYTTQQKIGLPRNSTEIIQNKAPATYGPITKSGVIDERLTINDTLREVNFCGTIYQAKQVLVNGVDVIQKIAEFATEKKSVDSFPQYKGTGEICRKIAENNKSEDILQVTAYPATHMEGGQIVYPIAIDTSTFTVAVNLNTIFEMGGPEFSDPGNFGVYIPIGNLMPL